MNKEIIKKVLNTESMEFSAEEIENLLNEELEKSPEEMDTDLVDICIEALSELTEKTKDSEAGEDAKETTSSTDTKTHRIKPIKKIFLIAAIVTAISVISISVSANVFKIDLPAGIAKIFENYISLDLSKNQISNLDEHLANEGLNDTYILPVFYDNSCIISSIDKVNNNEHIEMSFSFSKKELNGYITIRKLTSYDTTLSDFKLFSNIEQLEYVSIKNIDIYVSTTTDSSVILYYNYNGFNYIVKFEHSTLDNIKLLLNDYIGDEL